MSRFENLFLHLKAFQTRIQIDVNNFFVGQGVSEIYAKNTSFKNSYVDVFFVAYCMSKLSLKDWKITYHCTLGDLLCRGAFRD